ncbi:hypothetical protein GCM10027176_55570 [Actinoallomurus bryophytorum]
MRTGYRDGCFEVEVTNVAAPVPISVGARRALSGSRGVAGLRERLATLGGELTAGEQPGRPVPAARRDPDREGRVSTRLLICEDQELVRVGYVTVFDAQPDIEVVGEAANGPAAVDAAERLAPDVVVMDIRMPGLDGIECTRRIVRADAERSPKVLVVTTFNTDKYVYEALRAGASGFLLKDSPLAELVNGVRTGMRGESLLAPAVTRTLIGRFADRVRPAAAEPDTGRIEVLEPREREVLRLMAHGLSNAEIAAAMALGFETVKTYVSRILTKLGLRDRVQAEVFALPQRDGQPRGIAARLHRTPVEVGEMNDPPCGRRVGKRRARR